MWSVWARDPWQVDPTGTGKTKGRDLATDRRRSVGRTRARPGAGKFYEPPRRSPPGFGFHGWSSTRVPSARPSPHGWKTTRGTRNQAQALNMLQVGAIYSGDE